MPALGHPRDDALDDLNTAKRRVNKRAKKQASILTGRLTKQAGDYSEFRQQLNAILRIVTEMTETVKLTEALTQPARVIDRFVGLSTTLGFDASNLINYISSVLKRSFNSYSDSEVAEIKKMSERAEMLYDRITQTILERLERTNPLGRRPATALFNEKVMDLLENTTGEMTLMFQIINDALSSYKSIPSGPVEGGMRNPLSDPAFYKQYMAMKKGGGSPASGRIGMQMGFPEFLSARFPPRDRMDIKGLPRRFL